jgi:hypothetical protein
VLTQLIAPKITLSSIKLEPLPVGYSFQVSGPRSQELLFCVGSNSRTIPLSLSPASPPTPMYSGLAPFTHKMLEFREVLAGQTVPCWVVPRSRSNPREIDWNNKSNQQMISIPVYGAPIWSGLPDPPCSSLGSDWMLPVFLSAPKGRRIFYYANGTKGVFVTPENTLETSNSQRGFDIFSFWLATFGVAIKVSSGGVVSEEHRGQRRPPRSFLV